MNYLRGRGSGSVPPSAPPQDNFVIVNEGGSINSNNILAGVNRGRQDRGRSIQGSTQGQNQRGGGTQQGGIGQSGIPPEIHSDRATDNVRSKVTGPYQGGRGGQGTMGGGGAKAQREGQGYTSTSPTRDNNPGTPCQGGA